MSNCVDCSGNANPLDCDSQFMQCNNPCGVSQANTPACETLPSQIQNFTDQFFGTVVKTEINGQVVWSLPCSLDTGLPNNPRAQGEGLACYFLRLFRDGISGLTGPKGAPGTPGTDGTNTYSVTVQSFAQPSLNNPLLQVVILPNPSIIEGIGVFIQGSGQYVVTGTAPGGVVFLTMLAVQPGAPAIINAGALVIPIGSPAAYQGPAGPQGPPGISGVTATNGTWAGFASDGSPLPGIADYALTGAAALVVFGAQTPGFTVTQVGTYLVNVVIPVSTTAPAGGNIVGWINSSVIGDYRETEQFLGPLTDGTIVPFTMTAVITTHSVGELIRIRAYSNTVGPYTMNGAGAQISWVRVA